MILLFVNVWPEIKFPGSIEAFYRRALWLNSKLYSEFIFTLTFDILKMHVWDVDNNNTRNTPTQPRQTPKCLSFNRLGSISSALCWDNTISCVYKKIRQKLDKIRRDLWTDQSGITKTLRADKWHEYPVSPNWRSIRDLFMASKYMPSLSQGDIF